MKIKLIVILILLVAGFFLVSFLLNKFQTPGLVINTSSTTVIKQLQSLNRYETASFTIEKVIDAGHSGNSFQQFLYGDRLLLIANGQVVAGFDLSSLKNEDVSIDGKTIRLSLPGPQILLTKLDPEQTRVYDRKQGLLTKGDKDLETEARKAAEQSLTDAACKGNILNEATNNARNQLTVLLKALEFETVIVNIPEGKC